MLQKINELDQGHVVLQNREGAQKKLSLTPKPGATEKLFSPAYENITSLL